MTMLTLKPTTNLEAHLAANYGPDCYALKVLREVESMRAKIKLRKIEEAPAVETVVAVAEPVVEAAPKLAPVSLEGVDLHPYGKRWQAGEKISVLAAELHSCSWNWLHVQLTKLGYSKGV
jgi:hypothetical protein